MTTTILLFLAKLAKCDCIIGLEAVDKGVGKWYVIKSFIRIRIMWIMEGVTILFVVPNFGSQCIEGP